MIQYRMQIGRMNARLRLCRCQSPATMHLVVAPITLIHNYFRTLYKKQTTSRCSRFRQLSAIKNNLGSGILNVNGPRYIE